MGISSTRRDHLKQYVVEKEFTRIGAKHTICCLTLYNGFEVIGKSSCVDEKKFDNTLGRVFAEEDAFEELDRFFGMLEVDRHYMQSKSVPSSVKLCEVCDKPVNTSKEKVVVAFDESDNPIGVRHIKCKKKR